LKGSRDDLTWTWDSEMVSARPERSTHLCETQLYRYAHRERSKRVDVAGHVRSCPLFAKADLDAAGYRGTDQSKQCIAS
jgi:hypothetical protein